MFKYRLVDHAVPAIWRSLAAARLRADCPSGNAPTTRVRRLISRRMRSSGLLSGMRLLVPLSIPPGLRISATWVNRDEGVGSTRDGQAVSYDELRARVVIWPPSRLARVRCERESVVVV
jgi:hypothetical protein